MSRILSGFVVVTLVFSSTRSHFVSWDSANKLQPNKLQPVHGLYVQPSNDGTTGDLYVAASEDNAIKSQWLTDQPVTFLPVATSTQPHQAAVPYTSSYAAPTHDEKCTVMPSQPVQYAYAFPVPTGTPPEGMTPYPYAVAAPSTTNPAEGSTVPQCVDPASYSQFPYNYFYPHMMSAYANAMSVLKDAGLGDDTASSVISQVTPAWSPASYAYPMYVMVDPNTWASQQAQSIASTTSSSTDSSSNESV